MVWRRCRCRAAVRAASSDRIREGPRVLGHGGGDPGMCQLKQQGTTGAQKGDGVPVDPPGHRAWTKDALDRSGGPSPDEIKSELVVAFGDQMRTFRSRRGNSTGLCSLSQFSKPKLSQRCRMMSTRAEYGGLTFDAKSLILFA